MRASLLAASLLLIASTAHAASPSLTAVRPIGGQRGTELDVRLSGARLGDAQEVLFYQPGISVVSITKVDDNTVTAKFKIAADATLGLRDLRVRTATGVSELRTFSVGPYKEAVEAEPNNDFAKPQVISMASTVNGVAENEDVDFYEIEAKKGERISAEVEGARLGITVFDPYVAILDSKRFELSSSDDAALVWQDGIASAIAPEDGKYIISVRESAYSGNGNCLYRLHVGNFPRPTATVPSGGKSGEKVAVRWIGDVSGEKSTEVTLPASASPGFGIFAQDDKGIAPYSNLFRLSPFGNVLEVEPNEDQMKATAFEPPMALNGVIEKAGDEDNFVFHAKPGPAYEARVYARDLRSPLDPVIHLTLRGKRYIVGSDDNGGPDCFLRFGIPEEGDYVLTLHDHLRKGGPDYAYRIEVRPIEPTLSLSVPNEMIERGSGAIAVAVPKGNRQAILVNATRRDFASDLKILVENLPPGIEVQADPMAANLSTYPILFIARPDAAPAGSLATIKAAPVDETKVKIADQDFAHVIEIVNDRNNIPYRTRTVDRLAVAVTEEAPYSIEIVEPKVPLVRGGSMGLKIRAKRKEGFKAPISVYLPWNPPGVGSSGGIVIPEGQDEIAIPMNADGGAELKTWKIVVHGESGTPGGPMRVSSPFANLSVAEKFVTFAFSNAACEQAKETDIVVKVQKLADFPGEATATLIGLPNKASTDVLKFTKDTADLVYHVKTDAATPAGNHQNLFCQVIVTMNGEPIVHNLGSVALRVDTPLPPKPNAAPAPVVAAAPPPPTAAPAAPPKPLTRLEKLRLEQAEKAKAEKKP